MSAQTATRSGRGRVHGLIIRFVLTEQSNGSGREKADKCGDLRWNKKKQMRQEAEWVGTDAGGGGVGAGRGRISISIGII